MDPIIATKIADYLVQQGPLGLVCLVLGIVLYRVWRDSKKDRDDFDDRVTTEQTRHNEEVLAERARHSIEIAAERAANAELQEKRFVELKAAGETVSRALAILDATRSALRGSGHHEVV